MESLKENGRRIAIVTGRMTTGERKWRELHRLNISHFIEVMVTGAEARSKPAPDGIIKCIQELGLSAQECVYVGDSRVDIIAAKKAGVRTIVIPTGVADRRSLAREKPDYILGDLTSLLPCLVELQKTEAEDD